MPKTARKLDGAGGGSVGHPGIPPFEQGITTGRYTCPQAPHSRIGSTTSANRPTPRKLIDTPKENYGSSEEFNILTAGHDLRQRPVRQSGFGPGGALILGCLQGRTSWIVGIRQ